VLGNIGTYSGVVGAIFPGAAASLQAWAQYTNAHGGLSGHPVKIVSADDGGDPSEALSLAEQMVQSDGAVAFVGNMMPLTLEGIQPYLEKNNIPLIGGDETLPEWIQSPDIFPVGTDVVSIAAASLRLLTEGGLTKVAVLYCGESPSCKLLATGTPPPGVQLVYVAQISLVQTDFTTECLQAKSEGAQALFVAADAATVERVAASCDQQQYKPRYGTASIAVGPQLASDPDMEGLVAPVNNAPWFLTSTPATAQYAQAMATYEASTPLSAPGMSMWASGEVLAAATAGKLSAHPTSAEIVSDLDQVRGLTTGGLTPPLTYTAGKGTGPIPCYFAVEVQGGKWVAPDGSNPVCS
jgi:branched-chain amino acid transport system substrate-binding protein